MKFSRTGLITSILVVAALFIGSYISSILPTPDRIMSERPFLHEATLGEPVTLRTAEVTVADVTTALEVEIYGQIAGTSGVWIVFDMIWSPVHEPSALHSNVVAVRAADGRIFGGSQAVSNGCGPTQPGLPVTCQFAIEVDPAALEGAQLLVPAGSSIHASDDVAVIDLGIDAERADALSDAEDRIVLAETTTVAR